MLRSKNIDRICCVVLAVTLLITTAFLGAAATGFISESRTIGYESRLFDASRVHTIDIVIDDWEGFLETCTNEEYTVCAVIVDGESYKNVGIRAKGNTSLSSVASYGNNRYSFKIEFDHYDSTKSYHGLDKLSLNNLIQDKTFLKDYLSYTLMNKMGVASPLCSFVQIRVNGDDWGLYLAVESVEESFLTRNYGKNYGELYKPDSTSFGGGRGNGRNFDMDQFQNEAGDAADLEANSRMMKPQGTLGISPETDRVSDAEPPQATDPLDMPDGEIPEGFDASFIPEMPENFDPSEIPQMPPGGEMPEEFDAFNAPQPGGMDRMGGGMSSSDVRLQYTDDDPNSYSNIFGNAKTDITEEDQQRLIASLKTLSEGENASTVVDVEAVIRYFVVHNFLCNGDSYTGTLVHNYYLYEENGVLSMIPWDYNLAFGSFSMGSSSDATSTVNAPIDSPVSSGDISTRPMVAWIFESEEYTALYHEIYASFLETVFDSGWLEETLDNVIALIAPYVETDPTAFYTYDEFLTGSTALRQFCLLRSESISGQLNGTIPSTTEGQLQDSGALIDANSISLSDMGTSGGAGGNNGEQRGGNFAGGKMPEGGMRSGKQSPPDSAAGEGATGSGAPPEPPSSEE